MGRFLFQPTYPFVITQRFGENPNSLYYGPKGHPGLDSRARLGAPIYCAHFGMVIRANSDLERGLNVEILSKTDDGRFFVHKYFHGSALKCKLGDFVQTGQIIMLAGNTGLSEAAHLHFELVWSDDTGKAISERLNPEQHMLPTPAIQISLMFQLRDVLYKMLSKITEGVKP